MAVRGSCVRRLGSTVSTCLGAWAEAGAPRTKAADARNATSDFMNFPPRCGKRTRAARLSLARQDGTGKARPQLFLRPGDIVRLSAVDLFQIELETRAHGRGHAQFLDELALGAGRLGANDRVHEGGEIRLEVAFREAR